MPRIKSRRVLKPGPGGVDPATKTRVIAQVKTALATGGSIQDVATATGINDATIGQWMLSLGEEYHALRQEWLDHKLAHADDAIRSAPEMTDIARAREQFKSASWLAERRDPARYGQRLAVDAKLAVLNLSFGVKQEQSPMIDQLPAAKPDKSSQ